MVVVEGGALGGCQKKENSLCFSLPRLMPLMLPLPVCRAAIPCSPCCCSASVESLRDRGEQATEEDDRTVADLLLDQIEFADVLLLNKSDLVTGGEAARLLGLLRTLNPGADILPTRHSQVPLARVLHTGRFSLEKAAQSAGWLKVRARVRLATGYCC